MIEVIGILAVGAVFGLLIGAAVFWDHGFKAGVSWATRNSERWY